MEPFKAFWKKAWHDPVGSKLISGAILAGVGSFYLWAKSGFSGSLAVIWTTMIALLVSLSRPINFPVWVVLLTLLTFAVLAWWYYTEWAETRAVLTKVGRDYCDDNNLR